MYTFLGKKYVLRMKTSILTAFYVKLKAFFSTFSRIFNKSSVAIQDKQKMLRKYCQSLNKAVKIIYRIS